MKTRDFCSDAEVAALTAAFESGTIPPSEFTHSAHVAVALSYLSESSLEIAQARMRENLCRFANRHGLVDLYHETLTTFWMRLLDHVAANSNRDLPKYERINHIVARWGTRKSIEAHFSPDVIKSSRARREWVTPDRLPLPF